MSFAVRTRQISLPVDPVSSSDDIVSTTQHRDAYRPNSRNAVTSTSHSRAAAGFNSNQRHQQLSGHVDIPFTATSTQKRDFLPYNNADQSSLAAVRHLAAARGPAGHTTAPRGEGRVSDSQVLPKGALFDSKSAYADDYRQWRDDSHGNRNSCKQKEFVPLDLPFEGRSTSREAYRAYDPKSLAQYRNEVMSTGGIGAYENMNNSDLMKMSLSNYNSVSRKYNARPNVVTTANIGDDDGHRRDRSFAFDANTTSRNDYKQWPLPVAQRDTTDNDSVDERAFPFEGESTQRLHYKAYDATESASAVTTSCPGALQQQTWRTDNNMNKAFAEERSNATKFEGRTTYITDFVRLPIPETTKTAEPIINQRDTGEEPATEAGGYASSFPFTGTSTHRDEYIHVRHDVVGGRVPPPIRHTNGIARGADLFDANSCNRIDYTTPPAVPRTHVRPPIRSSQLGGESSLSTKDSRPKFDAAESMTHSDNSVAPSITNQYANVNEAAGRASSSSQSCRTRTAQTQPHVPTSDSDTLKFDAQSTSQAEFKEWPLESHLAVQNAMSQATPLTNSRRRFEAQSTQRTDFVEHELEKLKLTTTTSNTSCTHHPHARSPPATTHCSNSEMDEASVHRRPFDAQSTTAFEFKPWPLRDAGQKRAITDTLNDAPAARRPKFEATSTYRSEYAPPS